MRFRPRTEGEGIHHKSNTASEDIVVENLDFHQQTRDSTDCISSFPQVIEPILELVTHILIHNSVVRQASVRYMATVNR